MYSDKELNKKTDTKQETISKEKKTKKNEKVEKIVGWIILVPFIGFSIGMIVSLFLSRIDLVGVFVMFMLGEMSLLGLIFAGSYMIKRLSELWKIKNKSPEGLNREEKDQFITIIWLLAAAIGAIGSMIAMIITQSIIAEVFMYICVFSLPGGLIYCFVREYRKNFPKTRMKKVIINYVKGR